MVWTRRTGRQNGGLSALLVKFDLTQTLLLDVVRTRVWLEIEHEVVVKTSKMIFAQRLAIPLDSFHPDDRIHETPILGLGLEPELVPAVLVTDFYSNSEGELRCETSERGWTKNMHARLTGSDITSNSLSMRSR